MLFLPIKLTNIQNQADISKNPPIGVRNPITLKSNPDIAFVANKYIDPENKTIPAEINNKSAR